MSGRTRPRLRPLLVRPGARYRCFGNGLCCTDIHGLGPLTRRELVQIRRIDPRGAAHDERFDAPMLRTREDGACHFLLADQRCGVHARFGPEHKPSGCRRFPLGLVATPRGGRITTDHRCPCRSMGERPQVTPAAAIPSLVDDAGRLVADRRIERVSIDRRRHVAFATWEAKEAELLRHLARGRPPATVLGVEPYPPLHRAGWDQIAEELAAESPAQAGGGGRFSVMLGWVADAIRAHTAGRRPPPRARPWAAAFDRAETRAKDAARSARELLAEWVADEVWSLASTDRGGFERARLDLATRLDVAEHVVRRLRRAGVRADRAAAEAILIVESVGCSNHWIDVVGEMQLPLRRGGGQPRARAGP